MMQQQLHLNDQQQPVVNVSLTNYQHQIIEHAEDLKQQVKSWNDSKLTEQLAIYQAKQQKIMFLTNKCHGAWPYINKNLVFLTVDILQNELNQRGANNAAH